MRVALFCHSLVSDWRHGNAHFLRGVASELLARGHELSIFEPCDAWSLRNLYRDHGLEPLLDFQEYFPGLWSKRYRSESLDLDKELDGVELVLVQDWCDSKLVERPGEHRSRARSYRLFYHATHRRPPDEAVGLGGAALDGYDGVLASSEKLARQYDERGRAPKSWVWHEAADTRLFRPLPRHERAGDLVWFGSWCDEAHARELDEFLIGPAHRLDLSAVVHGARYPAEAVERLRGQGLSYGGWLANYLVPEAFARFAVTVQVPRGAQPIGTFEALACGIPLVSAPCDDAESLFRPGEDYLLARDGAEMQRHLRRLLRDQDEARALADAGLATVRARHTCAHRVDELLGLARSLLLPT
jgi:spore maturation protein CgeB